MEVRVDKVRGQCCVSGCKNNGKYEIVFKRPLLGGLVLCESCLRGMYSEIGKVLIPKSPENIIKKNKLEVRN